MKTATRAIEDINKEIELLKEKLDNVQGTETEVYTRIVGYYRSIKNWNKGKRAEYSDRLPFGLPSDYPEPGELREETAGAMA
jgi:anaerobic ribonucleoside-triphosphate reductase